MTTSTRASQPLVYACSGCSNVAQLANAVAVRLDRTGLAEMSCIAGVGGGVRPLVRKALSGRTMIAIDGCPLACCETTLAGHGIRPTRVVRLHELGLRKRYRADFTQPEQDVIYEDLVAALEPLLAAGARSSETPSPPGP